MNHRRLASMSCAATITLAVLAQEEAHAQPTKPTPTAAAPANGPPTPSLATSLTGEARSDYESAKSLFEIGDFKGAALKFKHSFELSKDPRLLWNMAACEKEEHHYGTAVSLVEQYLKEAGPRITTETRDNATATLNALRALSSAVTLTGVPDGAQIFVDGELVGKAPGATSLGLDLGSHKIRIEQADSEPFEHSVDGVTGGSSITIAVSLKPLTAGHLEVIGAAGETIALDGKVMGSERWEGIVAPGAHKLRVTATGKAPYEAEIDLPPRGTRTVHVSLHPESKGPLWPWVTGGAVLVAGAVIGGYFLLRSKDEPGSYPSGGLGTVVLPASRTIR